MSKTASCPPPCGQTFEGESVARILRDMIAHVHRAHPEMAEGKNSDELSRMLVPLVRER